MQQRIIQGLPLSFHLSFFPERRHLAALLKLTVQDFSGAVEEIAAKTGIPTGKKSGKVIPHLKYASAMGLIAEPSSGNGQFALRPTDLGRLMLAEDPMLHEPLTQLILHLMLSRPIGGAVSWHVLFGRTRLALGRTMSVDTAVTWLAKELGSSTSLPGPLFSTYREEASLARTAMLVVEKNTLTRGSLPALEDYYWGYAYCWLSYWEQTASAAQQLSLSELEAACGFVEVSGWNEAGFEDFLSWATEQGIVRIDRQTGTTLVMKTKCSADLVDRIYAEML